MMISTLETATKSNEGAWCIIVDFDGKPTNLRIKVMGTDSKVQSEIMTELMQREIDKKIGEKVLPMSNSEHVARLSVDWENAEWEGKNLPFSRENAKMVYDAAPFIREQVDRFSARRTNFIKPAQTESAEESKHA
jgi:hypothetical protein